MYHSLAIIICIKILVHLELLKNYYLYPGVLLLTIVIASLSYYYIEKPFISLKVKYSQIISGDNSNKS